MNLAPPIPRFGRGHADPDASPERVRARDVRRSANRTPAKNPTQVLQRERHDPDYLILMLVVALTAVGILMVYSSSAMRGYVSAEADTFATVGPQIQWAVLGLIAMAAMMRVDYRYLRLVSVPFGRGLRVGRATTEARDGRREVHRSLPARAVAAAARSATAVLKARPRAA